MNRWVVHHHWINRWMISLFFLGLGTYLVLAAVHRPRVLVVQSYGTDYAWTREVDEAMRRVFKDKHYDVKYHFMDTKNHDDADFKRRAGRQARRRIDEWDPDVLILHDDDAQSLVGVCYVDPKGRDTTQLRGLNQADPELYGRCHDEHPNIQLIFSGVGARLEDYGYDRQPNVTGILERMDVDTLGEFFRALARAPHEGVATSDFLADRRMMLIREEPKLSRPVLRVHAPIDDSTSGFYNLDSLQQLREQLAGDGIKLVPEVIKTFDEWRSMVENTNHEADWLLLTNYHTVKCGRTEPVIHVSPAELIAWTNQHSRLPALGAWGFFVSDGGMAAVGVSPYEQGDVAARMAVTILEAGLPASALAIRTTSQSIVYLRETPMRRYSLKLPRIFEAFARATDHFYACADREHGCAADVQAWLRMQQQPSTSPPPCQGQKN